MRACSFQKCVTDLLVTKTQKALLDTKVDTLLVSGGVASNSYIRNELENMCKKNDICIHIPNKIYCTDNATMIAAAAYPLYKNKKFSNLDADVISNLSLNINF